MASGKSMGKCAFLDLAASENTSRRHVCYDTYGLKGIGGVLFG
jgi:hypothetical protein